MRFSPSTLGWYPEFINYPKLPSDVITVSDAVYKSLVGKSVEVGPDGQPREYRPDVSSTPTVVSMRQARLALLQAGKLDLVQAAVEAADEAARIEWEFASTVERGSPFVSNLSQAIGLTEADLDNLFSLAATL